MRGLTACADIGAARRHARCRQFCEKSDRRPGYGRGGAARLETELGKEPLVLALGVAFLEQLLDHLACLSPLRRVGNRIRGDASRLEVDIERVTESQDLESQGTKQKRKPDARRSDNLSARPLYKIYEARNTDRVGII